MEKKSLLVLWAIILLFQFSIAQEDTAISWYNPAESNSLVVEGQAWPDQVATRYHRLPQQRSGTCPNIQPVSPLDL